MLKQTPGLPAGLADEDAKFIVNQLCFCMPGLIKVIAPCITEDFKQASVTLLCTACVKSNVSCSDVATKQCSHIFQRQSFMAYSRKVGTLQMLATWRSMHGGDQGKAYLHKIGQHSLLLSVLKAVSKRVLVAMRDVLPCFQRALRLLCELPVCFTTDEAEAVSGPLCVGSIATVLQVPGTFTDIN